MSFPDALKTAADRTLELLFPRRCPLCDKILPYGEKVCAACRGSIVYETEPRCMKCGRSLGSEAQREICPDCESRPHVYDYGYALAEYKSVARAVYRMKYKNRRQSAEWFGDEIVRHLGGELLRLGADALVPVPLHKKRLKARGYNQAADVARAIERRLNIPVREDLIARVRNTPPMKSSDGEEKRRNNLKNAFQLAQDVVKCDKIVIIDDIYTSGSTIDAVAREFRRAGVRGIYFVTVAATHI